MFKMLLWPFKCSGYMGKKKYVVRFTPEFLDGYKKLTPERRKEVDKAIRRIQEDPYVGEPSKPCPSCGEYFFHSDKVCPFCGHELRGETHGR